MPIILGFLYRLRGGGWNMLNSTLLSRIIWSISLACAVLFVTNNLYASAYAVFGAYASMMIPHAIYQNMGRWPEPQAWLWPCPSKEMWDNEDRGFYDFVGMLFVALLRSLIVFVPMLLLGIKQSSVFSAILILSWLQPLGYLIGWIIPITITNGINKNSAEWGEFFNGIAWCIAVSYLHSL